VTRTKKALPPIPATIPSVLGDVPVTCVVDLRNLRDEACFGIWRSAQRDVRLEVNMSSITAWQTYWHEWAHILLWDASIDVSEELAERLCDALATARVREMLDDRG
jgi:hypothetical protein